MLVIRAPQFDRLATHSGQGFVQRMAAFLRANTEGAADLDDGEMSATLERLVSDARLFGLATEQEVATYIVTAWLLGTEFPTEFPAAAVVLGDAACAPADKADWLARWTEALFDALDG